VVVICFLVVREEDYQLQVLVVGVGEGSHPSVEQEVVYQFLVLLETVMSLLFLLRHRDVVAEAEEVLDCLQYLD